MLIIPPQAPEKAIASLISHLTPIAKTVCYPPRKRLVSKPGTEICIFLEGEVSILRASDTLVFTTVYDPHIFGICEMFNSQSSHILRTEKISTFLKIKTEEASTVFSNNGLWQQVTMVLAYHTAYLVYRDTLVLQQRTYNVIRNHLMEMMALPEEIRRRVSALTYIQDRTHLSRSTILNVLSSLKKENYIDYERGTYLISISTLPAHF